MKKAITLCMALLIILTLAGCGSTGAEESSSTPASSAVSAVSSAVEEASSEPEESVASTQSEAEESETATGSNALVVYFSWSGNTATVAQEIQSQTGADIFEIVPAEPYTEDYNTLLDIAQEEKASAARPAISGTIENIDSYDTIYVGFPNWWGDMPMILYSFFDEYDLSGKTVAPFCTSGGSGFSSTEATMAGMEPDAVFTEGLHIGSSASSDPAAAVTAWLGEIG